MRHRYLLSSVVLGLCAISALAWPLTAAGRSQVTPSTKTAAPGIPKSIQVEHEAIHSSLEAATHAPGRVGAAAKELAAVLHPHFVREEQIALPPLGLLAPLAAGTQVSKATSSETLEMTTTLRSELPRMLDEHKRIRAAVESLRSAAVAEKAPKYVELAEALAQHAQTEEDVFYPAAVLVGDIIRTRFQTR